MGKKREAHAGFPADVVEDIEIEFIDEDSGADTPPDKADAPPVVSGVEPVDLGPSVEIEIERLESELDELRDIHLRKLAEFDNFRKRTDRERGEIKRHANEDLLRDLLPVLDNFERALEHSAETESGAFKEGVEMIAKQLWDTLERQGIRVVDPMGEPFSPELHEAVHRIESSDMEPGTIASVLAMGYLCNVLFIRRALVGVVAYAPTAAGSANGSTPNDTSSGETDE
jgi:molecular chaperone GrpE